MLICDVSYGVLWCNGALYRGVMFSGVGVLSCCVMICYEFLEGIVWSCVVL